MRSAGYLSGQASPEAVRALLPTRKRGEQRTRFPSSVKLQLSAETSTYSLGAPLRARSHRGRHEAVSGMSKPVLSELDAHYARTFGQRWHASLRRALACPPVHIAFRNLLVSPAERPPAPPLARAAPAIQLDRPPEREPPQGPFSGLSLLYSLDLASVLPACALAPQQHERVLDACAAPGGKALLLLNQMLRAPEIDTESDSPASCLLVANESNKRRLKRLKSVLSNFVPPDIKSSHLKVHFIALLPFLAALPNRCSLKRLLQPQNLVRSVRIDGSV